MASSRQPSQATQLALIGQTVANTQSDVKDIKRTLQLDYVTMDKFNALQAKVDFLSKIIYGLIGFLLLTFGTYIFSQILGGKK